MTTQDLKQMEELLDRKGFATKVDLNRIATKDDVKAIVKNELRDYATKDDVKRLATKDDVEKLKVHLEKEIGEMGKEILEAVSQSTISKKAFKAFKKRVEN